MSSKRENQRAIFLVNLGSPETPNLSDVRRYLKQFLMDELVIDLPYLSRFFLVNCLILPFRAKRISEAYKKIWKLDGSPLIHSTNNIVKKLNSILPDIPVTMAMRYGNPSTQNVLAKLLEQYPEIKNIDLIPLYPHFAQASYQSAVNEVSRVINGNYKFLKLSVLPPFYGNQIYIEALAQRTIPFLNKIDHLLFCFHGLPERQVIKVDPLHCLQSNTCCDSDIERPLCYRYQVFQTVKKLTERLDLPKNKFSVTFQSSSGKKKWLRPSVEQTLCELPSKGIKNIAIICPSFISDCLETLEELDIRGRSLFTSSGGESYHLIPCLNDSPEFLLALKTWALDPTQFQPRR